MAINITPLAGAFGKIERAKTQIDELDIVISAFLNSHPYEIVSKVNAQRTEEIWRFRLKSGIPVEISVRIGEILHNLRSALDQMAVAVAVQHMGSSKGTYFPFGKDVQVFEGELARKGKNLPNDARDMIRALKPYPRGNKLLWAFHDFNRGDKHVNVVAINTATSVAASYLGIRSGGIIAMGSRRGRHLVPDANSSNLVQPDNEKQPIFVPGEGDTSRMIFSTARIPSDKDMEFLTTSPGTKFEADFEPAIAIAFTHIKSFEREPVVAVLYQMRALAERVLLAFKGRFFP